MAERIANPCPTCGNRFDFLLTGCMTYVEEFLKANDWKCERCGMVVLIEADDDEEADFARLSDDPLGQAESNEQARAIPIVNLDLSVRCRAALTKLPAETVGDILDLGREAVLEHLGTKPPCLDELRTLFADHNVDW